MDDPGSYPLGHFGDPQDRPPVIVELNDISVLDAAGFGIDRMDANRLPAVTVFHDTMTGNVVEPGDVLIMVGVERKPRVGRNQLQRVSAGKL